jgi:hypothetical protein
MRLRTAAHKPVWPIGHVTGIRHDDGHPTARTTYPNGPLLTTSTIARTLKLNDVFVLNGTEDRFAVVIDVHPSNGEVRWAKHPVPFGTTAGGAAPIETFLRDYSRLDKDTELARATVKGASALVAKLPQPARWGTGVKRAYSSAT